MLIRRRFYKGMMASMRRNHHRKYQTYFAYNSFTLRQKHGRLKAQPQFRFKKHVIF